MKRFNKLDLTVVSKKQIRFNHNLRSKKFIHPTVLYLRTKDQARLTKTLIPNSLSHLCFCFLLPSSLPCLRSQFPINQSRMYLIWTRFHLLKRFIIKTFAFHLLNRLNRFKRFRTRLHHSIRSILGTLWETALTESSTRSPPLQIL
jgi:hypothetical protein